MKGKPSREVGENGPTIFVNGEEQVSTQIEG